MTINADDVMAEFRREQKEKYIRIGLWVPAAILGLVAVLGLGGTALGVMENASAKESYTAQRESEESRRDDAKKSYEDRYDRVLKEGLGADTAMYAASEAWITNYLVDALGADKVEGVADAKPVTLDVNKDADVQGVAEQIPQGKWARVDIRPTHQQKQTVTFIARFAVGDDAERIDNRGYVHVVITEGKKVDAISLGFSEVEAVDYPTEAIPEGYAEEKEN